MKCGSNMEIRRGTLRNSDASSDLELVNQKNKGKRQMNTISNKPPQTPNQF